MADSKNENFVERALASLRRPAQDIERRDTAPAAESSFDAVAIARDQDHSVVRYR